MKKKVYTITKIGDKHVSIQALMTVRGWKKRGKYSYSAKCKECKGEIFVGEPYFVLSGGQNISLLCLDCVEFVVVSNLISVDGELVSIRKSI